MSSNHLVGKSMPCAVLFGTATMNLLVPDGISEYLDHFIPGVQSSRTSRPTSRCFRARCGGFASMNNTQGARLSSFKPWLGIGGLAMALFGASTNRVECTQLQMTRTRSTIADC